MPDISGPSSTDNATFILWALPILLGGLLYLYRQGQKAAEKCEERNAKVEAKFDAAQTLTQTKLFDLVERNTEGFRDMASAFRDLRHGLVDREFVESDDDSNQRIELPEKKKRA